LTLGTDEDRRLLRSSPTPEGRCCPGLSRPRSGRLPRRCDPHRPRRVGAARAPVGRWPLMPTPLRSSPTPEGRCCVNDLCSGVGPYRRGCDPHRPRRVGAAFVTGRGTPFAKALRSSPTPEGRCCHQRRGAGLPGVAGVAILTDPGGSVLRPCEQGHRLEDAPCCDPHRPRRVGAARDGRASAAGPEVAILTDPGGSVLPVATGGGVDDTSGLLRSSPTPEGRCCRAGRAARRCP